MRITELRASGRIGLRDRDGEYSDWIELTNTGDEPFTLDGWYLSDDPNRLRGWEIPALTLQSGEIRVVFCSGKDLDGDELHTDFALSKFGGGVYLSSPGGALAESLLYGAMERDQVLRVTDAGAELSWEPRPATPTRPRAMRRIWRTATPTATS